MKSRLCKLLPMLRCCVVASIQSAHGLPLHVTVTLQSGKVHEDCFRLQAQQEVRYSFTLERPANFNLHFHRDKQVFYPLRSESVSEQKGNYIATSDQEYCLMWTGPPGGPATLGYDFIVVEPGLTKQ